MTPEENAASNRVQRYLGNITPEQGAEIVRMVREELETEPTKGTS